MTTASIGRPARVSIVQSNICLRCLINMHDVCYLWDEENDTCCDNGVEHTVEVRTLTNEDFDESSGEGNRRSGYKREAAIKDPHSTGRKRAAVLYPLDPEAPCEWQGLQFAGGGKFPILGCLPSENRKQTHRHHGPDKNTLNNDPNNVHRICAFCHNRWHAKNDPHYQPNDNHQPHDPNTLASDELALLVEFEEAKVAHTHDIEDEE